MLIYESEPRLERVRGFLGDAKASFFRRVNLSFIFNLRINHVACHPNQQNKFLAFCLVWGFDSGILVS